MTIENSRREVGMRHLLSAVGSTILILSPAQAQDSETLDNATIVVEGERELLADLRL